MSEVYFAPVTSKEPQERTAALQALLKAVSPELVYKKEEMVALKLTIGDAACVHHLHPDFVKSVVSLIKAGGAKPFLFDTSVIYQGQRQNAVDHLMLAQAKGFGEANIGAPFIVADGLLGQDGREYEIKAGHIKKVKIPSFIGMLDSLFVLSHATGHVVSGFAGAIKNVAMGMSCRATKQVQHSSLKPSVLKNKCTSCGCCIRICPVSAISFDQRRKAGIDQGKCVGCGECLCACKFDAIQVNWEENVNVFCQRMVEVAQFILSKFNNKFFITFAFDVTQECDCISTKDDKLVSRDIGILASRDIVSLDQAVVDLLTDEFGFFKQRDVYRGMLDYAAGLGLGNKDYQLVELT
ncbi:MAG: DUF362 domain-containing protein [Candidatus Omnitrophota bacterium]